MEIPSVFDRAAFWNNVSVSERGCWEWRGQLVTKSGYGQVWVYPRMRYAHRVAWTITHGDPGKLHVCHHCDNPKCINPAHLFVGTARDNALDMVRKGRAKNKPHPGTAHKLAKLTDDDVREIRRLYTPSPRKPHPYNTKGLAKKYGVAPSLIHRIVCGQSWAHVK